MRERYSMASRLLRVLRIVLRAGPRGATCASVHTTLVNEGVRASLRTVQRDLFALANVLMWVESAEDRVDCRTGVELVFFFDHRRPARELHELVVLTEVSHAG